MKILLVIALMSLIYPQTSTAEDVNVNVNNAALSKSTKKYEIAEGHEDLSGDSATLKATSALNWKKACSEWRAELKMINKQNSIISHTCGKMTCDKNGVETTCTSKAQYKIRVLVEE